MPEGPQRTVLAKAFPSLQPAAHYTAKDWTRNSPAPPHTAAQAAKHIDDAPTRPERTSNKHGTPAAGIAGDPHSPTDSHKAGQLLTDRPDQPWRFRPGRPAVRA